MRIRIKQSGVALAAASSLALAGGGIAVAATTHHRVRHAAAGTATGGNAKETVLTGTALTQASAAALAAAPGGTVGRASIEDPSDTSGAAYEVHVTKADGTRVEVLLDSSFKALSVKADAGHGPGGGGPGGGNPNETVLTGTTLTQASDAAVAAVPGGAVTRASTEDKSDTSGAAYEVKVTKADGSRVEVLEDSAFKVLSVAANAGPGGTGPGGH